MLAAGSRGDVAPIVALGAGLAADHDVTVIAGDDFEPLITAAGLRFSSVAVTSAELISSELGVRWLAESSHNPVTELRRLTALMKSGASTYARAMAPLEGTADLFVSGILTVECAAMLATRSGARHVCAQMSPIRPSASPAATLQPWVRSRSSRLNLGSSRLLLAMTAGAFTFAGDELARAWGEAPPGRKGFVRAVLETPTLLGASPVVVPPPDDWPPTQVVTGYWTPPSIVGEWSAPSEVEDWLAAGPPPVYVGFGSMPSRTPEADLQVIAEAGRRTRTRLVVHSGMARLSAASTDDVLFVDHLPHAWLFPRMAGVVHHGGAGTTGAALRSGIPSVAVAHIGDQPYWARRLHELGVGPRGIRRHQLSVERLGVLIDELRSGRFSENARRIADLARAEDGVSSAVSRINDWSR